jgi:putative ABC transport system substrate-binding protein
MKRRGILHAAAATLIGFSLPARPRSTRTRRIAIFHPGTEEATRTVIAVFRATLKELNYIEGRDVVIEVQWGAGKIDEIPSAAAEIVARKPDVIVTATSAGVAAFKKATSTIPIVFATAGSPVEQGFVASLGRPGGNITGVMVFAEMGSKMVEVAREAFPSSQRLAILLHAPDPAHKLILEHFAASTPRFHFEPVVVKFARVAELDRVFKELTERKADVLYVADLAFNHANTEQLIERALQARLPLISNFDEITLKGGLLSYGGARYENYRRAAMLVDKILRGAKPADIPVEQPDRFPLVINRRTARAIGVTLSPVIMFRADRIID